MSSKKNKAVDIEEKGLEARHKAARRVGRLVKPRTREELRIWVRSHARMDLPEKGVCEGHCTPLDYLEHVFFEKGEPADTVVWACRGGGKTKIGAVATLLDLVFKPGIEVRILGGSKEQSEKMYGYLCGLAEEFADMVKGKIGRRGFSLRNGSRVEILTQSETSVRGTRVQKLRCDELDMFKEGVWDAAQLTTRTMWMVEGGEGLGDGDGGQRGKEREGGRPPEGETPSEGESPNGGGSSNVRGAIEVFSTLHRPAGLMSKLVGRTLCPLPNLPAPLEAQNRKIFQWCIWDVAEKCDESARKCEHCALLPWCKSSARNAAGFVPIDDILRFQKRTSRQVWESEMLCGIPYPEGQVFPKFRADSHVRPFVGNVNPGTTEVDGRTLRTETMIAGIDYGWKKFVCLWLLMLRDSAGRRVVWALDEYVMPERALDLNAASICERPWKPAVCYADVAGNAHDPHSAQTSEAVLRAAGLPVRSRTMRIDVGIQTVDALIDPPETWGKPPEPPASPAPRLLVDPRCVHLIQAFSLYSRKNGDPVKDGVNDHLIDALRYAVQGHDGAVSGKITARTY